MYAVFKCVIVGLTTVYKLTGFVTLIFAVFLQKFPAIIEYLVSWEWRLRRDLDWMALCVTNICGFWESDLLLISVFNGNHTSIIHQFRYNEVFLVAQNDVIAFFPLGGVSGESSLRTLIDWPRLCISLQWLYYTSIIHHSRDSEILRFFC